MKENNILLADFLELLTKDNEGNIKENLEFFDFHKNWNLLMLVVEKIEEISEGDFSLEIEGLNCKIYGYMNFPYYTLFVSLDSKIKSVYNACVEFVKWYNNIINS